jgi:hypothetical protein
MGNGEWGGSRAQWFAEALVERVVVGRGLRRSVAAREIGLAASVVVTKVPRGLL